MRLPNILSLATLFLALPLGGLVSCGSTKYCEASPAGVDTSKLAEWMTGSFSSAAQSVDQPEDYFDIRLYMVPIWTDRADGPWLYVEQAAATNLARPYRQRVYHLVGTDLGVRSEVYTLPGDALKYAGFHATPEGFSAFGPDELTLRHGCSIQLVDQGDTYTGATLGNGCASTLGGAAYATSEVSIAPEVITSWDRGFDSEGKQAWGAVKGPYIFLKE